MGKIVGLIPARGGSKGIPRKNIVDIGGKPLISFVIEAGKSVSRLNGLYVSTEDIEIAKIARKLGAHVINRPQELAKDNTPSLAMMQHAIQVIEGSGQEIEWLVLLQPTYPFILPSRIESVIDVCQKTNAESVTTTSTGDFRYHPYNARSVNEDGTISFRFPKEKERMPNRQSAPLVYFFGNIVASRKSTLLKGSIYGKRSASIPIESWEAIDINEPFDLTLCQLLISYWGGVEPPIKKIP